MTEDTKTKPDVAASLAQSVRKLIDSHGHAFQHSVLGTASRLYSEDKSPYQPEVSEFPVAGADSDNDHVGVSRVVLRMPIRVSTKDQRVMRQRRKAVTDCYICGTPLRRKAADGKAVRLSDEHVIPISLLDTITVEEGDRVPIILDVHKACEDGHKAPNEQLTLILIKFFTLGERGFHRRDVGVLRSQTHAERRPDDGFASSHLVVPDGTDKLLRIWARGLMAALYGQSLPHRVSMHVSPPVPVLTQAKGGGGATTIEQWSVVRDAAVSTVMQGVECDCFDELTAWGGHVRFTAVWRHLPRLDAERPWSCCWTLEMPGYRQWSEQVLGYDNPWHGLISTETLPDGASVLTDAEAERQKRVFEMRRKYGYT
jgi:hypothetical protein